MMRMGLIARSVAGTALLVASVSGWAPQANADLGESVSYTEPRGVLVMPFDVTDNHKSFQLVSRIGNQQDGVIATHWSYWSESCAHLGDVIKCLTENDTTVSDPQKLVGERQSISPPENVPVGGSFDLSGHRGIVTVTAFEADTGPSGLDCRILDASLTLDDEIAGAWTIADTSTNAAFGTDAIGMLQDELPDAFTFLDGGIVIQTFNPPTLGDSDVIMFGVEVARGNGRYLPYEIGPIRGRGQPSVCCDLSFYDDIEVHVSLPEVCFDCAMFAPISAAQGPSSLLPASITVDTPLGGFLYASNCTTIPDAPTDCVAGLRCPPSEHGLEQFIFAYHGQAVGQFGAVVSGKYLEPCPQEPGVPSQRICPPVE